MYWLAPATRAALEALVECNGRVLPARILAARAGLASRHQLARLFHREGLPSMDELSAWVHLLTWTMAWESERRSLCRSALRSGRDPAVCYRVVRRLTGLPWSEVRALGTAWLILRLLECCHPPAARAEASKTSAG
jgi:hypothetical protein